MKKLSGLCMILAVLLATNPAIAGKKAPKTPDGGQIAMFVLVDRNTDDSMSEGQVKSQKQIGTYMEKDLVKLLKKFGYAVQAINGKEEYSPGSDTYLLSVTILKYNAGSSAARSFIGYGAGAASMDIHYELSGEGGALLSKDDGVGTSQHWKKIPRKLNVNMRQAITDFLQDKYN